MQARTPRTARWPEAAERLKNDACRMDDKGRKRDQAAPWAAPPQHPARQVVRQLKAAPRGGYSCRANLQELRGGLEAVGRRPYGRPRGREAAAVLLFLAGARSEIRDAPRPAPAPRLRRSGTERSHPFCRATLCSLKVNRAALRCVCTSALRVPCHPVSSRPVRLGMPWRRRPTCMSFPKVGRGCRPPSSLGGPKARGLHGRSRRRDSTLTKKVENFKF